MKLPHTKFGGSRNTQTNFVPQNCFLLLLTKGLTAHSFLSLPLPVSFFSFFPPFFSFIYIYIFFPLLLWMVLLQYCSLENPQIFYECSPFIIIICKLFWGRVLFAYLEYGISIFKNKVIFRNSVEMHKEENKNV